MSETPQTITLSDGSVWEYAPKGKAPRGMLPRCHWAVLFRDGRKTGYGSPHLLDPMAQLTASDYRKIADVLQPPAARPKLEAEWRSKLTAIRHLVDLAKSYPETAKCKTAKRTLEALDCAAEELATLPAFPVADPPRESEDTELLDWLEAQGNGHWWVARDSVHGRGFRLHNTHEHGAHPLTRTPTKPTAREALRAAREASK